MYIRSETVNTLVIEKSKFITYLYPCFSEDEYKEHLKALKKKYYDASHVCSAFIAKNIRKSSDDGEPSGTAGIPMLTALDKAGLINTCAFTVRYFGGVKLGAGGLLRAYSSSVSECLKKATFLQDIEFDEYELKLDYDLANKVVYLLEKEATDLKKEYDSCVTFTYLSNDHKLTDKIKELTSGKQPQLVGKKSIAVEVK